MRKYLNKVYVPKSVVDKMKYLNEDKIYKLTSKIENTIFKGESLKYNMEDIFDLHKVLMTLQQLVKLGIIGFDEEGFVINTVKPGGNSEQTKQSQN